MISKVINIEAVIYRIFTFKDRKTLHVFINDNFKQLFEKYKDYDPPLYNDFVKIKLYNENLEETIFVNEGNSIKLRLCLKKYDFESNEGKQIKCLCLYLLDLN